MRLPRGFRAAVGRLVRGLAAVVALSGVLFGLPWLLVVFIGWPLPDHVPTLDELTATLTGPLDDAAVLDLLALFAWTLWALFVRDVIVEAVLTVIAARQGRLHAAHRRAATGPVRFVAAVLVGTIAASLVLDIARGARGSSRDAMHVAARTPTVVAVASAEPVSLTRATAQVSAGSLSAARPTPTAGPATPVRLASADPSLRRGPDVPGWARDAPGGIHRVVKGDNLWDIADADLDDPHRWREIYVLNRGKPQANGYVLTDPDIIHIGWVLALPARPTPAPTSPPPASPGQRPDTAAPTTSPTPEDTTPSCPSPAPTTPAPPAATAAPAPAGTPPPGSTSPAPVEPSDHDAQRPGVSLPSGAWITIGLAAAIAATVAAVRLHQRRHARLPWPVPTTTSPSRRVVPESLRTAEASGAQILDYDASDLPGVVPAPPVAAATVGTDPHGREISLYQLAATGIAITGPGAQPAARAMLAAALSTAVLHAVVDRPVVVTPTATLARLLPPDIEPAGLDPNGLTYDGERLTLATDADQALAEFETEMLRRRRTLDDLDAASHLELHERITGDHLPPHVLMLADPDAGHIARLRAVASQGPALNMHTIVLGTADGLATCRVAADGSVTAITVPDPDAADHPTNLPGPGTRLSTLAPSDLADLLNLLRQASYQREQTTHDEDPAPTTATDDDLIPAQVPAPAMPPAAEDAVVHLTVLGDVALSTDYGPITKNVRRNSYALLALLAAYPNGRSLHEIAANLFPDTEPGSAFNLVRTATNSLRQTLRAATGRQDKFILFEADRYRIDSRLIEVDLWRMLAAIDRANRADDDPACLDALQEAVDLYRGDLAAGQPHAWITDYATTYRHQILGVLAHIAELTETDDPDRAIAALERALDHDPINEELYQRIMRIQGRRGHLDAVRRTLHLCQARLAEIGETEPSETTYHVASRQLRSPPLSRRGADGGR